MMDHLDKQIPIHVLCVHIYFIYHYMDPYNNICGLRRCAHARTNAIFMRLLVGGLPFSPHPIDQPSEAWHVRRQSIWWMINGSSTKRHYGATLWQRGGRKRAEIKWWRFSGQGMSEWANRHKKHTRDRRQYAERRNTLWWWRIFQILDKSVGEYVDREQKVWKIARVKILESASASSQPAETVFRNLAFLRSFPN